MQQNKGQPWSKYIPNYAIKLGAAAPISDTSWLSFLSVVSAIQNPKSLPNTCVVCLFITYTWSYLWAEGSGCLEFKRSS